MAKAFRIGKDIFPNILLKLSHEEAMAVTQVLSTVALDSPIRVYEAFEAMDRVMEDFLPPRRLCRIKIELVHSGIITLKERVDDY